MLQPGGQFLFNIWNSLDETPLPRLTHRVVRDFFPDDPPGFYEVPLSYHDHDDIHRLLTESGFHEITSERVAKTGIIRSAADAAIGLIEGNPIAVAIATRDAALLPTIRTAVAREIEKEFGPAPVEVPLSASVIRARA